MDYFPKCYVHGNKIITRINRKDKNSESLLEKYSEWKKNNEAITGTDRRNIGKKVKLLNEYKNYINNFPSTAQSKLSSSVLEEFLYYLFKDFIANLKFPNTLLGGIRAYNSLYFCPTNLKNFQQNPFIRINEKDQDFSIYRKIEILAESEKKKINVPVVSIECKTYLDKTMLEGSIATAEKIKLGNPYCLFLVVTETYSVSYDVDPKYSRIDQIFVLRKDTKKKPIYSDVVYSLFTVVANHLSSDWSNIEDKIKKSGKII